MASVRWVGVRRTVPALVAVCALLTALLAACGRESGAHSAAGREGPAIQRMLDRRAEAVRERDATAFLSTVDRQAARYRTEQRRIFANLADVPLRSWTYQLTQTGGFEPSLGTGHRVAARVELRYRVAGYDTAPVTAEEYLTLAERGGHWYVASEDAGGDDRAAGDERTPQQLWEQGPVRIVRGKRSLVLAVGQEPARLRAVADIADRAVPAVDDVWPDSWAERVVVEVPASLDAMAALLGASADGYRGIAAVTTGEIGRVGATPADRVIVNPEAYDILSEVGRQVVMTHETTHVATRRATTDSTPLWLSEGFADWAGYRGTASSPRQAAPELASALSLGKLPEELPEDDDFRFAEDADRLSRAYEEGWLACRMVARQWGEKKLVELYQAVGKGKGDRDKAVDSALREVLKVDTDTFTLGWRKYMAGQLR